MDVLSDVLSALRLTGALFFDVHARAPWVVETPPIRRISERVMPDFDRVIAFHAVMDGVCFASPTDGSVAPVKLECGDAVIFVGGEGHLLGSEAGKRARPNLGLYYRPEDRPLPFVIDEVGGRGEAAQIVCGFLGCDDRPFNPIVDELPPMMHVRRAGEGKNLTCELIRVVLQENKSPSAGGEIFLAKLSELLFLQAVRQHIGRLPADAKGWLAGLRDVAIAASLRLMHARPSEPWTLEALAKEIGLSRSGFAERFSQVMGMPAMQYLGNWRLQVAARLLERPNLSLTQVASSVGYESEAAFNRAFKKRVGTPPGSWRRERMRRVQVA